MLDLNLIDGRARVVREIPHHVQIGGADRCAGQQEFRVGHVAQQAALCFRAAVLDAIPLLGHFLRVDFQAVGYLLRLQIVRIHGGHIDDVAVGVVRMEDIFDNPYSIGTNSEYSRRIVLNDANQSVLHVVLGQRVGILIAEVVAVRTSHRTAADWIDQMCALVGLRTVSGGGVLLAEALRQTVQSRSHVVHCVGWFWWIGTCSYADLGHR